ncbi:hypothetical protein ABBQ38_009501 [Trebouxia sp. C0009 RCD-2024]
MIHHDWVKCNDDVRQLAGVCSSWLRGRDPSMTLEAFRNLWCHRNTLASIHTAHTGTGDKLELVVNLSDMWAHILFFFFFFFFWVTGEMSIPLWQEAFKDARRT